MKAPRAIAFDLDGTLVDSRKDIAAALNLALADSGRPALPEETIAGFVGDGARTLCARAAGLPEDHADVGRILEGYLRHYLEHPMAFTRWMPGAREALDELGGYELALMTNKPRPTVEAVLAGLGVADRFAAVVAEGDLPEKKPSPAPVLWIAKHLGISPAEIVVVGDGPQDVQAGRRAGARTVAVRGGFALRERLEASGPDALIESLAELPGIVNRWK